MVCQQEVEKCLDIYSEKNNFIFSSSEAEKVYSMYIIIYILYVS